MDVTSPTTTTTSHVTTDLSDAQHLVISLCLFPTTILSIIGSSIIIRDVRKRSIKKGYDRILLCLSVCDIFVTLTFVGQRWLSPKDYNNRITSLGNHASCQALGFALQLSSSCFYYSGILAFYCKYALTCVTPLAVRLSHLPTSFGGCCT